MGQITTGIRSVLARPAIYDRLQKLIGGKDARASFVLRFLSDASGKRLLDLGCGTAEILAWLPDDTDYVGYDVSPDYIAAARQRFQGRGAFYCAQFDASRLQEHPLFDLVLMAGLLHHLDDPEAAALLKLARRALSPAGRLVTIDGCFAAGQSPAAWLLIALDRGRNVRRPEGYEALAAAEFGRVSGHLIHRRWPPYTHWVMECAADSEATASRVSGRC